MTQPIGWGAHRHSRALAWLLLPVLAALGLMLGADRASAQDEVALQIQVKDQQRDAGGREEEIGAQRGKNRQQNSVRWRRARGNGARRRPRHAGTCLAAADAAFASPR